MADTPNEDLEKHADGPIWDGLYGEDAEGPYLIGGRCSKCGFVTLGARQICPGCLEPDTMGEEPIGRRGTLYACTVIHQAAEGFEVPFAVGYVDIGEEVRVFAHIENTVESRALDGSVELTVAPLKTGADGAALLGPRYRAVKGK